jgi:formylglycine-generating enzyme required for sulfatase activity
MSEDNNEHSLIRATTHTLQRVGRLFRVTDKLLAESRRPPIETVLIPAGTFIMGSPTTEPERYDDEVQHQVTLSAFRLSTYLITNAQYAGFLNEKGIGADGLYASGAYPTERLIYENDDKGLIWNGTQWQPVSGKDKHPVVYVTWYGAAEFADYVGGRLPTEAEWEYACRAGSITPFNTGRCLSSSEANYNGNYPYAGCSEGAYVRTTTPVGSYKPNAWGLYDMHGNVWEWCADWYGAYATNPQTNPTGPATGARRVFRGGCCYNGARICRSAFRNNYYPHNFYFSYGFRVAFVL